MSAAAVGVTAGVIAGVTAGVAQAEAGVSAGVQSEARVAQAEGLLDVYRLAERADPQLRGYAYEVDALRAERREALAGLLPSLVLSGEIRRTSREEERAIDPPDEAEGRDRTFTQEQYQLFLSQPLFDLPVWHRWQGSRHNITAGEAELEARRQELIHRVAEAYLGVLGAQAELTLQERELESVAGALRQAEALFDEAQVSRSQLEQARARHDTVRADKIRAEGELEVARERLSELTDRRHGMLAELSAEAELPPLEPFDLDVWLEHAYAGNPRIVAARAQLDGAGRQVQSARAERYPAVDLVGGYTRFDDMSDVDSDVPSPAEETARKLDDWYIGVRVQVPLYEGGAVGARTRSAESRRDRQREEVERVRREVRADARGAFQGLVSGRSAVEAYAVAVRSNARTVAAMQDEVELGTRDVTDLLEAQRDYYESRRNLAQARYQYLVDTLKLRRASGHLGIDDVVQLNALFVAAP
ncbi:TolC family outer membrane protein [Halorhodospira abdelmalekii]|uniref:TolC family outer membrane protein n=1 Tax=Halorhodospira abdelmalekii TaxID=421629 RepID=UPI0019034144